MLIASSHFQGRPRRFVVIGVPGGRRVELFQAALARQEIQAARVISWLDVIRGELDLRETVGPDDVVRIDSPGRDWAVEKALLVEGAPEACGESARGLSGYACAGADVVGRLEFDRGRVWWPRQWYAGFARVMRRIGDQLRECAPRAVMGDPAESLVMFDKQECHARLSACGVAVPEALREPRSYVELVDEMRRRGWQRVFVKLAHGSSGSGVVAYQTNGREQLATTTVELVRGGAVRMYNSRQVRTYNDPADIAVLFDELCRHKVHVERWLPKAGIGGRSFDLRVVVIGGSAAHVVVRASRTPMTNLHLLNERGDGAVARARMGEEGWARAMQECERAMRCFPRSLHGGIDLLVGTDFRKSAVLEVNAFGDLLPGITWCGLDTYEAQIRVAMGWTLHDAQPLTAEVR